MGEAKKEALWAVSWRPLKLFYICCERGRVDVSRCVKLFVCRMFSSGATMRIFTLKAVSFLPLAINSNSNSP